MTSSRRLSSSSWSLLPGVHPMSSTATHRRSPGTPHPATAGCPHSSRLPAPPPAWAGDNVGTISDCHDGSYKYRRSIALRSSIPHCHSSYYPLDAETRPQPGPGPRKTAAARRLIGWIAKAKPLPRARPDRGTRGTCYDQQVIDMAVLKLHRTVGVRVGAGPGWRRCAGRRSVDDHD